MLYTIVEILLRAAVSVAAVILLARLNGLRSFAKMSGFDFAITVATGSVLASTIISPKENLLIGLAALAALFAVQGLLSRVRAHQPSTQQVLDNSPLMIMRDGEILQGNLVAAQMTPADLYGKLRGANAYDLARVKAVIVEPTGDVSVLHGKPDGPAIDPALLEGVRQ